MSENVLVELFGREWFEEWKKKVGARRRAYLVLCIDEDGEVYPFRAENISDLQLGQKVKVAEYKGKDIYGVIFYMGRNIFEDKDLSEFASIDDTEVLDDVEDLSTIMRYLRVAGMEIEDVDVIIPIGRKREIRGWIVRTYTNEARELKSGAKSINVIMGDAFVSLILDGPFRDYEIEANMFYMVLGQLYTSKGGNKDFVNIRVGAIYPVAPL